MRRTAAGARRGSLPATRSPPAGHRCEVSRSEVTKGVMDYAKSHNLMEKQTIKADAALRKLLSLSESDNLSILTLQKHLRNHYVKTA